MPTAHLYELDLRAGRLPFDDNSQDAALCDPPYGLSQITARDVAECLRCWLAGEVYLHGKAGFMGRAWDAFVPGPEVWREVYRVLKPGASVLAFGGTRTYDLLTLSLRLAGFEIRDSIGVPGFASQYCSCGRSEDGSALPQHGLHPMRAPHLSASVADETVSRELLLSLLPKHGVSLQGSASSPTLAARSSESRVERRGDGLQKEGKLCVSEISPCARLGGADGASRPLPDGAPPFDGRDLRSPAGEERGCPPSGSQPAEQRCGELGTMAIEWIAQGGGAWPACSRCGKPLEPPFNAAGPLAWVTGQGFPKSLDISKAIDTPGFAGSTHRGGVPTEWNATTAATSEALPWEGYGTALKPAWEPVCWAMKPADGTCAAGLERRCATPSKPRLVAPPGSEIMGALRAGWEEVHGFDNDPVSLADAERRISRDAPLFNVVHRHREIPLEEVSEHGDCCGCDECWDRLERAA